MLGDLNAHSGLDSCCRNTPATPPLLPRIPPPDLQQVVTEPSSNTTGPHQLHPHLAPCSPVTHSWQGLLRDARDLLESRLAHDVVRPIDRWLESLAVVRVRAEKAGKGNEGRGVREGESVVTARVLGGRLPQTAEPKAWTASCVPTQSLTTLSLLPCFLLLPELLHLAPRPVPLLSHTCLNLVPPLSHSCPPHALAPDPHAQAGGHAAGRGLPPPSRAPALHAGGGARGAGRRHGRGAGRRGRGRGRHAAQ